MSEYLTIADIAAFASMIKEHMLKAETHGRRIALTQDRMSDISRVLAKEKLPAIVPGMVLLSQTHAEAVDALLETLSEFALAMQDFGEAITLMNEDHSGIAQVMVDLMRMVRYSKQVKEIE